MNTGSPTNHVIDIGGSATPKLGVADGKGTIRLSNLPATGSMGTVNFGPGVSLLMNPSRQRAASPRPGVTLADLSTLDRALGVEGGKGARANAEDKMLKIIPSPSRSTKVRLGITEMKSDESRKDESRKVTNSETNTVKPVTVTTLPTEVGLGVGTLKGHESTSGPGSATKVQAGGKASTWDGFKGFKQIPVDPTSVPVTAVPSKEAIMADKLQHLRKLEALQKQGVHMTKQYTMNDSLLEMKGEYEMIKEEKEKAASVNFQGKMLMACISAIEFLNSKFDPLDIRLDGWSESISENMSEYDEVFGELHAKYGGTAKMAPELKLLFMLGGSATMIHMTNTMFKSSMPGMDDILRQNPELMQQFTHAAARSMGASRPGLGSFMGMGQGPYPQGSYPGGPIPQPGARPVMGGRPHGFPQATNGTGYPPYAPRRPDLVAARGYREPERSQRAPDTRDFPGNSQANQKKSRRPEMKGPKDIGDILAGLKTKKVSIHAGRPQNAPVEQSPRSMSLQQLKQIGGGTAPKKSKRKPRSERNTISLNI